MPTYAYRWGDGTVSICSAKNKDEAMTLFDEIDVVSRKLIIRLKSPIVFTVKASVEKWWVLDEDEPLGERLSRELEEKCYPNYRKTLSALDPDSHTRGYGEADKQRLAKALKRDEGEAEKRLRSKSPTMDIVAMFPKGLPGQEN